MKLLKLVRITVLVSALGLGACATRAQDADQIKQLKLQLEQMQANFDRVVREQQAQIEGLKKQIAAMQPGGTNGAVVVAAPLASATAATASAPADTVTKGWSPTDPIRIGKGGVYADIGLVATFAAGGSTANDIEGGTQLGGHDPNQRGFTVQGVELNLQGAIDPYFRGNANILFSVDSDGESFTELEEAWMETVSLPANLQIRAGQILTDFGRINTQHPHAWAFVDSPLVAARFLGPDGLRNPGARLSWLVPTPFYSELFLSVQDSQGETAYSFRQNTDSVTTTNILPGGRPVVTTYEPRGVKSITDLLFTPRYVTSFDLSDSQTLVAGVSAAFGPNSTGNDADTQIYGADLYWKWKPANAHGGFPFVSWQTEAMLRRYDAASSVTVVVPGGREITVTDKSLMEDWGFYSQVAWGFSKGWVAALRGDYVAPLNHSDQTTIPVSPTDDLDRASRWRISPNLTWYPSEFSKIRLQYNYDDRDEIGVDHSVWLQFEFLLGAHAAHKF